jgi:EAL domain-containing protein (putative c-di-GMP-specific phosphodiesterase class I)
VLLEWLSKVGDVRPAAERLLGDLIVPVLLSGRQSFLRASVGIAVSVTGYARAEDALRDADAALYRARSLGGNRCEVFDTTSLESAHLRLQLESDLERALERREFFLVYQPILSLASNRIVGLEALVRWRHPTQGLIPPLEFIPIAERSGLIIALGRWVLREACLQLKAWQASLPARNDLWVSVNLSALQFRQAGLVEQVGEALRDVALDPPCLMLELTESAAMESPSAVKTQLMQLRVMGVRVGLDDFGTGHSAFAYLHQFPADYLKVDRSFIRGMETRQDKADIVAALVGLARQLGLQVIAEGIESEQQLSVIQSLGCDCAQGFLISRPVDREAAADLLRTDLPRQFGVKPGEEPPQERRPDEGTSEVAQGKRLTGRSVYLYIVFAAVALLVSVGLGVRFGRGPGVPVRAASRPVQNPAPGGVSPVAGPSTVAALAAVQAPKQTPTTTPKQTPPPTQRTSRQPAPKAEAPAIPLAQAPNPPDPPAPELAVLSFGVVHQHMIGSCLGVLNVSAAGVSFVPDKGNHAFTIQRGQFQSTLADGTLTIKVGDRPYRFKAANAAGKDEELARLQDALSSISRTGPK